MRIGSGKVRSPFITLAAVAAVAGLSPVVTSSASAAALSWKGATDGLWGTATNWSAGTTPTTSDTLTILGPANVAGPLNINLAAAANASTLNFTDTSAVSLTNTSGADLTLTLAGTTGNLITTGTGAVTIGSNAANQKIGVALNATLTWSVGTGGLTVNGPISGNFGISKGGQGTLTLSGANTYTGSTTVGGGTLVLTNGASLAGNLSLSNASTSLLVKGNSTIAGTVGVAGTASATSPVISLVDGTINTLTLSNTTTTSASGAILQIGSGSAGSNSQISLELGSASDQIVVANASNNAVRFSANGTPVAINLTGLGGLTGTTQTFFTAGGTFSTASAATPVLGTTSGNFGGYTVAIAATTKTLSFTESANAAPVNAYYNGGVASTGGTTAFNTFTGGNTNTSNFATNATGTTNANGLIGSTSNVYLAANNITTAQSVSLGQDLTVNSLNFTGTGTVATPVATTIAAGNTLTINGSTGYTDSQSTPVSYATGTGLVVQAGAAKSTINAPVALGNSQTWEIDNAAANALTVNGAISGAGKSLTKTGTGTLLLGGTNTYTGSTAVNAGALAVGSGASIGSSAVTVASGATLTNNGTAGVVTINASGSLNGSGTFNGLATVNGSLNAGNSGVGTDTFAAGLSLGGTTAMDVAGSATAGSSYDYLNVTGGTLTYGGTLAVQDFGGYSLGAQNGTYDLFDSVLASGSFSAVTINGITLTNAGGIWSALSGSTSYTFTQSTGDLSVQTNVPEPASLALLGLAGLMGLRRGRRVQV